MTPTAWQRSQGERTDTCPCGFEQALYLTKAGKVPLRETRYWTLHIDALETLANKATFAPGAMIGQAIRKRGAPMQMWVYHTNDPAMPAADSWGNTTVTDIIDEAKRWKPKSPFTLFQVPYVLFSPWHVIRVNQVRTALDGRYETRSEAIGRCLKVLNQEEQKGYEVEIGEEVNVEGVLEAPMADLTTYIERFVTKGMKARTVGRMNDVLQEIEEMRMLMSTVDELEEEMRRRIMGGLADL